MKVKLKRRVDDSYDILIEQSLFASLAERLFALFKERPAVLITDSNVGPLYGDQLEKDLQAKGISLLKLVFDAGEENKNRQTKQMLEDQMLQANITRDGYVIALGGGVTGDLAGYVAATYLRGIPFVQVPTTLLSQVDSSVGGKTGVDTQYGKNMIGAFYQPEAVFIDPELLATLPEEQFLSGMGEVIKHALMFDKKLASQLVEQQAAIKKRDPEIMRAVIATNCAIKAKVVEKDEKEGGMRKLLNFGHTAGHAIEQLSGYQLAHGLAVLQGICLEAAIACRYGLIQEPLLHEVFDLVGCFFPVTEFAVLQDIDSILDVMQHDKKNKGTDIYFVFPEKVGLPMKKGGAYAFPIPEQTIRAGVHLYHQICDQLAM